MCEVSKKNAFPKIINVNLTRVYQENFIKGNSYAGLSPKTIDFITKKFMKKDYQEVIKILLDLSNTIIDDIFLIYSDVSSELDYEEKLYICRQKNFISDPFLLKNLASLKKNNYDVNEAEKSLRVFYSLLFYLDSQNLAFRYGESLKCLQEFLFKN